MDFMSMSKQEILDLAIATPEYDELINIWPPFRTDWSDREATLTKLRQATIIGEEMDEQDSAVVEEDIRIPARDGHENRARVFRAKRSAAPGALVVLYHGGGCIMGSPTMMADTARRLVKNFGNVVVAPAYRLAPEFPFPTSINDGWDSLQWIARNAVEVFQADPSKGFVVGGISAGAHMAVVFAHLARDDCLEPRLTGLYSACGSIRSRDNRVLEERYRERLLSRSQAECIHNPVLSKELQDFMQNCCQADAQSKLVAPMLWPDGDGHKNLPKAYLQICGRDVNRDESFIFDDILKKSGVQTRLNLYPGLPHCFWIMLGHLPEAKQWRGDTVEGFAWLLAK